MNWHLFHRWEPIAKHSGDFVVLGGSATVILFRCTLCGKLKSETIDGHWSRDELGMDPLDDWRQIDIGEPPEGFEVRT